MLKKHNTKLFLFVCLCLFSVFIMGCAQSNKTAEPTSTQTPPFTVEPATKKTTEPPSPEKQKALTAWKSYSVKAAQYTQIPGAFRMSGSLRYTTPESTERISSLLWGNGKKDSPYPLRLDLVSSIGSVGASIVETHDSFMAYLPSENTVFMHAQGARQLVALGIPIPLALNDMVLLLTGHGHRLLMPAPFRIDTPMPEDFTITEQGVLFETPNSPLPGKLLLSLTGVPLEWRETLNENVTGQKISSKTVSNKKASEQGWVIRFESSTKDPLRFSKLRINHPKGYDALINVNDIAAMPAPFSATQLSLPIPDGANVKEFPAN